MLTELQQQQQEQLRLMRLKLNASINNQESLHLPLLKPYVKRNPYQGGIKNITRSVIDKRTEPVIVQKRTQVKNGSVLGNKDTSGAPVKPVFLSPEEQKTFGDRSPKGYQKLRLIGK